MNISKEEPMNKKPLTTKEIAALEKARHLFADWRKSKTGRARIPENLWQTAADLYHSHGMSINRIARSLSLGHSTLKAKIFDNPPAAIESFDDPSSATGAASPMFVELPPFSVHSECVIEMENQSGTKIRLCLRGRADPAVLDLGRYFLAGVP
jgi:hypothetical protein